MAESCLLGLPTEILLNIQTSLGYASRLALSYTCHELYSKVNDLDQNIKIARPSNPNCPQSTTKTYDMLDLLEIELWPVYNSASYRADGLKQPSRLLDYFACHLCLKIRSASKFSNAMMKSKRGKLGHGSTAEKAWRFCIPCGLIHGKYQRGVSMRVGGMLGAYGFVCRRCGEFEAEELLSGYHASQQTCSLCQHHDLV